MNKLKRTTYFYRSLLSYFLIFILPILIFAGIFQFRYKQVLQDELITNNHNKLNILQFSLEKELDQIQEIVQQFIVSNNTTPFELEESQLKAFDLLAKIKQYNSTNAFSSEIAYYFHGKKYIYTSSSTYKWQTFINEIYDYENWETEAFKSNLEESTSPIIRPNDTITIYSDKPAEFTTFIYPISIDGVSFYASLIFWVPQTKILSEIEQVFPDDTVTTIILDKNKKLIASNNLTDAITNENYAELLTVLDTDNSSEILTIDKSDYVLASTIASGSGWQYITFVSLDSALKVASDIQTQFILVLLVILLAGVALIYLLMSVNYSPIRNLQKLSETVLKGLGDHKSDNELDAIKLAINYLSQQNSELCEAIDDTKQASKEYVVGQLLSGQNMNRDHLDSDIITNLLRPEFDTYIAFIAHITHEAAIWSELKLALMADIEAYTDENLYFICKESDAPNCIITIALYNSKELDAPRQVIDSLRDVLSKKWHIGMTIGVGDSSQSLDDIPKSYMGASTAFDYRLMVGTDKVIYYNDIVHDMKAINDYPYAELKLFKHAITKGSVNDVDTILNNIVKQFTNNTMPLFVARGICYEIITTVVENAQKLGADHQELFKKYPDIFSITKYESVYKIIEIVKMISYDVCKSLNETYDKDHTILMTNMTTYICDNYMDSDFTLQSMSDHYNMQKTNLSTFYKEHSGRNIFEYITELRMETAEDLLITSDLPVNQICSKIGYDNVSSFIRRFKQVYGVTPGKYRLVAKRIKNPDKQ